MRKFKSAKNNHLLSYGAKTISDHFRNSNFLSKPKKDFKLFPVLLT